MNNQKIRTDFTPVILESPFSSTNWIIQEQNIDYARRAVAHSLSQGEAPFASHLLYTQPGVLDDTDPDERTWGIGAGLSWKAVTKITVVYTDYGITKGMQAGIDHAERHDHVIHYRTIL